MRIALLFEFPTLYGGERSILAMVDELQRRRPDLQFQAIGPASGRLASALAQRGMPLTALKLHAANGSRLPRQVALRNLNDSIRASNADVVHANSLAMGRLTGALGETFSLPRIAHVRDILRVSRAAIAELNQNDRLIAVSDATRSFHVERGLDGERVLTIHNGIDCSEFAPRPRSGSLQRELDLSPDAFLALSVGQIGLRKGHDVTAAAVLSLTQEVPQLHVVLSGERSSAKAESVEFERDLALRFEQAGRGDHLHLLGYRTDVPRLMNEADLLIHAAHQEPLGRVLLEAAASGLPIVATDVGGTSEILEHRVSAELVVPGDAPALAAGIRRMSASPGLRQRYAAAARKTMESRFSISTAARNLASVYDTL